MGENTEKVKFELESKFRIGMILYKTQNIFGKVVNIKLESKDNGYYRFLYLLEKDNLERFWEEEGKLFTKSEIESKSKKK